MNPFHPGDRVWHSELRQEGRVVEARELWGQTLYDVWLLDRGAVVRARGADLAPIAPAERSAADRIAYIAAAARVAEALTEDVLLAPLVASVIPLPHQVRALKRATATDRVRYLLADEVGLGKTIEAGLILRELKLRGLAKWILVVAPKGLVTQWVSEMKLHFGEEFRLLLPDDLAALRRLGTIGGGSNGAAVSPWRLFDQVICPLDSVKPLETRRGWSQDQVAAYNRERFEELVGAGWDLVVVDEAHRLAGSTDQVDALLAARLAALTNERSEVGLLLELARAAEAGGPDAKAEALLDWVYRLQRDEVNPDVKVLIFTEFVPTQEMLRDFLSERGFPTACLNGSLEVEARRLVQSAFAHQAQILVSTDAGGEGLNLQFAHIVVNYDMPWNPMRVEQRIGRVDRIGQTRPVQALNFVLADTVEHRVQDVLEKKLAVILKEFGVDKTGDILDSAQAGQIFDELHRASILNPDSLDARTEAVAEQVREGARAAREAAELPAAVSGFWSLWRITLRAADHDRQRILPLFVHDDERVFGPTARRVWLAREAAKADYAYAARLKAIERIGLPEVRAYRVARLDDERRAWRAKHDERRSTSPDLEPLLLVHITGGAGG